MEYFCSIRRKTHLQDARQTVFLPPRNFNSTESTDFSRRKKLPAGAKAPTEGSAAFGLSNRWERRNGRPSCKIAAQESRVNTYFGKWAEIEVPKKGYFAALPISGNPRWAKGFFRVIPARSIA
jgi:hypothetical protein